MHLKNSILMINKIMSCFTIKSFRYMKNEVRSLNYLIKALDEECLSSMSKGTLVDIHDNA